MQKWGKGNFDREHELTKVQRHGKTHYKQPDVSGESQAIGDRPKKKKKLPVAEYRRFGIQR